MTHWPSSRTVVIGVAVVVFLACCVLPIGYLLTVSLIGANTYSALLLDARQRQLLVNTAILGTGTAIVATTIGSALGFALARISLPQKSLVRLALTTPILLPPYIVGLAWTYLGSANGRLAGVIGADVISGWTYSLSTAIVVLGLVFYPIAMLATEAALRHIDGRLEEAALVIASRARVFWRITLPLAAPAAVAAALLIFVLAVSEFSVPGLLQVRVYTTEVFTAFAALYDFPRAILLTVPLLLLCVAIAALAAFIGEPLLVTRRSSGVRPVLFDEWNRPAIVGATGVLFVSLVLPLAVLVGEARTAQSLSAVLAGSAQAIVNSLRLAITGATAVVIVAVCLGYARARAGGRIGAATDVLFIMVLAIPSTVIGVALIGLWNREGPFGRVYGTDAMVLMGYLARFLPVAALALAVSTRYVPVSHEEAASVSGARWPRTLWRIVLPQIRMGVVAAWAIAFVLAFGELGVSILVAPPGEATLPIRVYTLIANTPSSNVAAMALFQAAIIFAPLAALALAVSHREGR
jgi:iron(III) transport system permease protein